MNGKLTLTLEKSLIEQAKKYAKSTGKSPSAMVNDLLVSMMDKGAEGDTPLAPIVESLRGTFTEANNFKPKNGGRKGAPKTNK